MAIDPIASRLVQMESRISLSPAARALSGQGPAGLSGASTGAGPASGIGGPGGIGVPAAPRGVDGPGFGDALRQALQSVNVIQEQASNVARDFQFGKPDVSLEDTVIAGQKASISFQAAVQIRNRVVQAYQEVMNMNV
jgi:flagellar hook-basal body complex protein FliE